MMIIAIDKKRNKDIIIFRSCEVKHILLLIRETIVPSMLAKYINITSIGRRLMINRSGLEV